MSQWYAVVDAQTGEAVSFGDVLGESVDALAARGLDVIEIADQPRDGERWNAEARRVEQESGEVRAARLAQQADALLAEAVKVDPTVNLDRTAVVTVPETVAR